MSSKARGFHVHNAGRQSIAVALLAVVALLISLQSSACGGTDAVEPNTQRQSQHAGPDDGLQSQSNAASSAAAAGTSGPLPSLSDEQVMHRLSREYGAVLVARSGAVAPPRVTFATEAEVATWQSTLVIRKETLAGIPIELQDIAMKALLAASAESKTAGHSFTPRGTDAGRRNYADTVRLWTGRVDGGLRHWVTKGALSQGDADLIRALSPTAQVPVILALEDQRKLYFSTNFARTILSSVAAPGSSQHLTLLAFDLEEHANAKVRAILEKHQWYQTVVDDTPHFTFLGASVADLPALGLEKVSKDGRGYWVPVADGPRRP